MTERAGEPRQASRRGPRVAQQVQSKLAGTIGTWEGGEEGLVLAIDTSTRIGGVAVLRGARLLGEDTWQAGGHQTAQVLPAAMRLLERAGATVQELRLIVVATGPGSFTGLRVGASIGKGLSLALGIPLVGVATLDALAFQAAATMTSATRLIATVSAGRGQYYAGTYSVQARALKREGEFAVLSAAELLTATQTGKGALAVGELEDDFLTERGARAAAANRTSAATPLVAGVRRAGYLAELGRWTFKERGAAEAALLQPIYLRRGGDTGPVAQRADEA